MSRCDVVSSLLPWLLQAVRSAVVFCEHFALYSGADPDLFAVLYYVRLTRQRNEPSHTGCSRTNDLVRTIPARMLTFDHRSAGAILVEVQEHCK